MGSGRFSIHVSRSSCSIAKTYLHIFLHSLCIVDFNLQQIFNINPFFWAFLQIHFGFRIFTQQIMDFLIVNLNKTTPNQVCFRAVTLSDGYDLAKSSRNYAPPFFRTRAHHRMSFPAAGLPIGENGAIIAIKHIIHQRKGTLFVNWGLKSFWCKNAVEGETFWLLFGVELI